MSPAEQAEAHRQHVQPPNVAFEHRWPAIFNLGDFLCSPRHYFQFELSEATVHRPVVLGGGAYNDLGIASVKDTQATCSIAWGIGRSVPYLSNESLPSLQEALTVFSAFSTRDPALANEGCRLVPCVSVMHDLVDLPPGKETMLILNQNPVVGGIGKLGEDAESRFDAFAHNALPEQDFVALFEASGRIVTNSYHGAYWALLSGREVQLIGYSSKFDSLLALLNLDASPIRYRRGDHAELIRAMSEVETRPYLKLAEPKAIKERFRTINRDYARSLVEAGLFAAIRERDTRDTLAARERLFHLRYPSVANVASKRGP